MNKAITTRRLPATNTKPDRIVATDLDGRRLVRSLDLELTSDYDQHLCAAVAFARQWNTTGKGVLFGGAVKEGYVWVFVDEPGQGRYIWAPTPAERRAGIVNVTDGRAKQ